MKSPARAGPCRSRAGKGAVYWTVETLEFRRFGLRLRGTFGRRRSGGRFGLYLGSHFGLEFLADDLGQVARDAALPDLGRLGDLAGDDRPLAQQLLAGVGLVEGGDRVELRLRVDARIGERHLALEIGAAACHLKRLLVDGLDDHFLQVGILLDQLLLQRDGRGRQDVVIGIGGANRADRRLGRLDVALGDFLG